MYLEKSNKKEVMFGGKGKEIKIGKFGCGR